MNRETSREMNREMNREMKTADYAVPSAPARILVVDDSEASRYITARWLRRGGHDVLEADTGTGALAVLREHPVELVVLDVRLPDMSGFEVCERIKSAPETAMVPVVHVSATFIESADRTQGLTRGADAYLVEPVDPGELLATVEAVLRGTRARVAAERLAHRLNLLTEASLAINTAHSYTTLVTAAAEGAAAVFGSAASVLVSMSDGWLRHGSTDGPGAPVSVESLPIAFLRELAASHFGSGAGAQIGTVTGAEGLPGRNTVAVLVRAKPDQPYTFVGVPASAVTTQDDRNLLLQLGQASALAAQSQHAYNEEHRLALTLQRSLLPSHLPQCAELSIAARYVPASANVEIGGDFYEVIDLDGKLLIAIGDVTGHSIEAATIMGEVRHALRAYAAEGHGPGQIIKQLNTMLRRYHPRGYTTLCILLVDLAAGTITMANAGHLPPLFIDQQGSRYIRLPGPLLGVDLDRPDESHAALPPGTTVLLMTDGLVERRGVPLDDEMEKLRNCLTPGEDVHKLCDRLLRLFGQDKEDDIALLAFHRR